MEATREEIQESITSPLLGAAEFPQVPTHLPVAHRAPTASVVEMQPVAASSGWTPQAATGPVLARRVPSGEEVKVDDIVFAESAQALSQPSVASPAYPTLSGRPRFGPAPAVGDRGATASKKDAAEYPSGAREAELNSQLDRIPPVNVDAVQAQRVARRRQLEESRAEMDMNRQARMRDEEERRAIREAERRGLETDRLGGAALRVAPQHYPIETLSASDLRNVYGIEPKEGGAGGKEEEEEEEGRGDEKEAGEDAGRGGSSGGRGYVISEYKSEYEETGGYQVSEYKSIYD